METPSSSTLTLLGSTRIPTTRDEGFRFEIKVFDVGFYWTVYFVACLSSCTAYTGALERSNTMMYVVTT
jgi:hypothetical protein